MSFDVAVSTLVFHHLSLEGKRQAISEIVRVLLPGGRFLLADMGPATTLPFKVLTALVLPVAALTPSKEVKYARDNMRGVLPVLLQEAGFTVKEPVPPYRGIHLLLATKSS
jgi:ubiquinone/menaquinone biosynthesis C-methylase UbiE